MLLQSRLVNRISLCELRVASKRLFRCLLHVINIIYTLLLQAIGLTGCAVLLFWLPLALSQLRAWLGMRLAV